jgi:hypothetical protein
MQGLRTAWKEAALVFVFSRFMIILISYTSTVMLPSIGLKTSINCTPNITPCLFAWYHYDAQAYVRIAHQGYSWTQDIAFFPLLPLLEHAGAFLLGGSYPGTYYLAGLLIANSCFYLALVLLYCLLSKDFDPTLAKRGLFYFAFSPYALFFFVGYTESLFVLLSIAIFVLLRREKLKDWWLAGFLGFLAVLTRSSGIILVIPFLIMYVQRFWRQREQDQKGWLYKLSALAPVILIPAGIVAYMLYLGYTKGNPLLLISAENNGWHRHFSLPWNGIGAAIGIIFTQPPQLQNLLDLSFTLIPLGALIIGWRHIPLDYRYFALGLAIFSLSFPQNVEPLASQPRYLMILFPVTAIFALWGKRTRFDRCFIVLSLSFLAINTILFINHYWVA